MRHQQGRQQGCQQGRQQGRQQGCHALDWWRIAPSTVCSVTSRVSGYPGSHLQCVTNKDLISSAQDGSYALGQAHNYALHPVSQEVPQCPPMSSDWWRIALSAVCSATSRDSGYPGSHLQ